MTPETKYNLLLLATIACALCAVVGVFVWNIPAVVGFAIASITLNFIAQQNKPSPPPAA